MAGKYNKYKQDGGHLGFPFRIILATADLQVISILPMNFESIALLVQEKKFKIDIQDGRHGHHLGFPTGTISAIFDVQVTLMLPTNFRVSWPFGSEEAKNRFTKWPPWPSWIRTILAIFDLPSHPDDSYFRVNWPFGSGEEAKNRFSRWPPRWPS